MTVRKMCPYTARWWRLAGELAASRFRFVACEHCGGPKVDEYVCDLCDDGGTR